VGDPLLGAQEGDDLGLDVEGHAEPARVVPGDRLPEGRLPAVARILVRRRVARAGDQRVDDVAGRRHVGVADAETDDVDAGGAARRHLALDLSEQVRREVLHAS